MLNVFSFLMLSSVPSTLEGALYRTLAGVAHALFWQSSESLTSINSSSGFPVRNISMFIGAWILGFMVGPLIGKLILNLFDCYALFQIAAATMTVAIVPSVLLRYYSWSDVRKTQAVRARSVQVFREITNHQGLAELYWVDD